MAMYFEGTALGLLEWRRCCSRCLKHVDFDSDGEMNDKDVASLATMNLSWTEQSESNMLTQIGPKEFVGLIERIQHKQAIELT